MRKGHGLGKREHVLSTLAHQPMSGQRDISVVFEFYLFYAWDSKSDCGSR